MSHPNSTPSDPLAYLDTTHFEESYEALRPACIAVLEHMRESLALPLEALVPAAQLKGRVKRFPSLFEKLQHKLSPADLNAPRQALLRLPDLLALRAVCPFLEDVDIVVATAQKVFQIWEIDTKGDDRSFAEFGYSSTHLGLCIPPLLLERYPELEGFRVELQIRTILQDAWAEVEHELIYKVGAHPLNQPIRRKLAALNAMLVLSDTVFQEIRDYQKSNIADLTRARSAFLEQANAATLPSLPRGGTTGSKADVEKLLKKALNAQIAGEMEDAVRIYTELCTYSMDNFTLSVVLNHRGMARESLEQHVEAVDDFLRARQADPRNARAGINLGLAYRRLGRLEEAERELRTVLEFKPNSAHAHYGLARVQADRREIDAAILSCNRALKLSKGFSHAQHLLNELLTEKTGSAVDGGLA